MINKPYRMLERVKKYMPFETTLRISNNGVPHLVFFAPDEITYSICYFAKKRRFKIFYPYPSYQQTKIVCKLWTDVLEFFNFKKETI